MKRERGEMSFRPMLLMSFRVRFGFTNANPHNQILLETPSHE